MLNRVVETGCGPVEYSEAGTGDPILYFHGTGITGDVMLPVESRLIEDGFRLIVPNRPGYGRTPLTPHTTAVACGNVAAALLDVLDIDHCSVMGSSGGAAFAASFAACHPARVQSLVLLCPQLHRWDDRRWLPVNSRWTLPFLKRRTLRRLLLWLYRVQLPRMSVAQYLKMQAGQRFSDVANDGLSKKLCEDTLAAMVRGTRHAGFENDFLIFKDEVILGSGTKINVPTLVLHDAQDPMAPVEHVDWFVSHVPHCQRVSLHAAGHLVWSGPDADAMHESRVRFLKSQ